VVSFRLLKRKAKSRSLGFAGRRRASGDVIRDHRALSRRAFRSGADLLVLLDFCSSDHRLKPVPLEKRRKAGPSAGLGMTLFFVSDVAARLKPCPDENQMQRLPASESGRYKGKVKNPTRRNGVWGTHAKDAQSGSADLGLSWPALALC